MIFSYEQEQSCFIYIPYTRIKIKSNSVKHPPDDDTLILLVTLHVTVGIVSDSEDMRRELSDLFILVQLDLLACVYRQNLVRVNRHKDGPRICLSLRKKIIIIKSNLYNKKGSLLIRVQTDAGSISAETVNRLTGQQAVTVRFCRYSVSKIFLLYTIN